MWCLYVKELNMYVLWLIAESMVHERKNIYEFLFFEKKKYSNIIETINAIYIIFKLLMIEFKDLLNFKIIIDYIIYLLYSCNRIYWCEIPFAYLTLIIFVSKHVKGRVQHS